MAEAWPETHGAKIGKLREIGRHWVSGASQSERAELADDLDYFNAEAEEDPDDGDCVIHQDNRHAFNAWLRFGRDLIGSEMATPQRGALMRWCEWRWPDRRKRWLRVFDECLIIAEAAKAAITEGRNGG